MSDDLRIALTASLNDKLVGPFRRAMEEVEKNLQRIERDLRQTNTVGTQAGGTLANMKGPQQATRQAAELARETRNAITLAERLRNAWSATGNVIKGVAQGVAAFQAARMVLAQPMQQERTYSRQLADLANTAYADLPPDQRISRMGGLDSMVVSALRQGGGKREGAVEALNTLMAMGGFKDEELAKVMPEVMRASTASNADPKVMAELVGKALKNGFTAEQIPEMVGKAIASGQAGGFEMRDMSKWLPKLLSAGSTIGMRGMKDFEEILAMAQVSATTAGGSDEAGNNLLNFLLKVNSNDTQQDAKKQGIDLSGTLVKNRGNGMSAASAFLELLRTSADKDPRMIALRKQYAAAGTDGEKLATLESQRAILSGTALGKFLQDRQALMPAIASLNNPEELQRQLAAVRAGGAQTTAANFQTIASTADFKVQQTDNERLFAQTKALEGANGALGKLAEFTTELYQKYPGLAQWIETSTLALKGLAAAAAGASAAALLMGKGLFGGAASKIAGSATGAAAAGGAARAASHLTGPLLADVAAGAGAGAALSGGAAIGMTAAGAALVGAPILAAGMYLDNKANSPDGLRSRIGDRSARIAELDQLLTASRDGGASPAYLAKLQAERDGLAGDRSNLTQRLGAQAGGGRGFTNPGLTEAADAAQQRVGQAKASEDLARVMAKLDQTAAELKAVAARPVVVQVDGREIASSTNAQNAFEGRRQ